MIRAFLAGVLSITLVAPAAVAQTQEDRVKARKEVRKAAPGLESVAPTAEDVAKELANPATPLSSIGNHLEYRSFKGDLSGVTGHHHGAASKERDEEGQHASEEASGSRAQRPCAL